MTRNPITIALCAAMALSAWPAPAQEAKPAAEAQPAPAPAPSDPAALAQEVARLRAAVEKLEAERKAAEERVDVVEVKSSDAVVVGDLPGSFRVPGTELSLRIYGFAELNWVHAFQADNSDVDYSTFAPYLPLNGTPEANRKNRDYLTARTSRFGIEGGMPTRFGVLGARIEGDFNNEPRTGGSELYGSGRNVVTQQQTSSYGFRIRHAYGQFAGLLAGMTWSTFMDVDNFPETLDYNGPIGATFIRQPQIRFAYPTLKAGTFTAALENSSTYALDGQGNVVATSLSRMPDLVLRWDRGFEWGAVSLRAVTQDLHVSDGAGVEAAARGYGAAASISYKFRDVDFFALQVTGGHGIGRYLNYVEGAFFDADGRRMLVEDAVGAVAGYQLKATPWVRVNLVYGVTHSFDSDYTDFARANGLTDVRFVATNRWVHQVHFGPIFTPIKAVDMGVEAIWAQRTTVGGTKGDDTRLNFSAKYYIN
ncbi:MAG TPA: DcaP family trimeric outer membrane transporter [Anaeromyxobacteraceae bacterium]|nr:DcaP family trimeric outer membrane transporter [Anaeromyxobacteraceae bacterium]